MPSQSLSILALNRGILSRLGLARVDLKRAAWSAEEMVNWMPRTLGSMMLRPGWEYILTTQSSNATRNLPFVRSATAKAILELTANIMRVVINDALVTRVSVSAAVTNGNFTTDLSGWTDNDDSGGVSAWVTGGYMGLTGNGTAFAIRDQVVTVTDVNIEHALRIVIKRGPVILRVGTATTDDSYIPETTLETGDHSLSFTPTGNFNIRFKSPLERQVLVDSCNVEAAGVMTLPTPWGASDLDKVRAGPESQSIDVLFVACSGITQRRIERRGTTSWSVAQYLANDGPFRVENTGPITIAGSALFGNITLTASAALFKSTHAPSTYNAGALFSLTSSGQTVNQTITVQNTFSGAIRVTGVGDTRKFTYTITGLTGTGSTVTLQQSVDSETGPWTDLSSFTADVTSVTTDGLDNQIIWYRIGVKTGNYSTGTILVSLVYAAGSITGIVRITSVTTNLSATAEVLSDLGNTSATDIWAEGEWSDARGWPSAPSLYESRLWWAGLDKVIGSITDSFDGFDINFEGDAGPISRSIGAGPVEDLNWLMPLNRLIVGGLLAEFSCRSTSFDEPLTPSNFNIKPSSRQGSANVQSAQIDDSAVFVQRGGTRLFELELSQDTYSYKAKDLCLFVPEICLPSIVRVAVQRQPDTRIHCVLSDGTAAVLVYDSAENVMCWLKVDSDGASGVIEDVVTLPGDSGDDEDQVYYTVKRTINGATVRYLEKWALESECVGGALNKQADAFKVVTNSPASTTVSGLSHLEGESVCVWADGMDVGTDANGDQIYVVFAGALSTGGLSYLSLPGTANNYASTPDSAALSITGDIDLRANISLVDWIPGALSGVISKWTQSGITVLNSSYRLSVESNGTLSLRTTSDGTTVLVSTSTDIVHTDDGERTWIRATMDVDNGSGGNTVQFFVSDDGVTWDQLGNTVVNVGTTSIFDGTSPLYLGGADNNTQMMTGTLISAEVRNGIAGSVVASFDAADGTTGATSVVSSATGETYAIFQTGTPMAELFVYTALAVAAENIVVGLPYDAQWKSAKLGTALTDYKNIDHLGLILADTHASGLEFGPDFDHLDPLPMRYQGAIVDPDQVYEEFDAEPIPFPGGWSTDSRLCLEAHAPRPVTILAAVVKGTVNG